MRLVAKQAYDFFVKKGIKKIPGWLVILYELGFSPSELQEIQELEDENMKQRHSPDYYNKQYKDWMQDPENKEFLVDIYKTKVQELKDKYKELCDENYRMDKERQVPYWFRKAKLILSGIDTIEKQIKSFTMRLRLLVYNENGKISPEQIVRAREYPIERFMTINRGYVLCPFHNDSRPSMWVKNNFGYCFSCGAYADAIELMMKKTGLDFVSAVKSMQ